MQAAVNGTSKAFQEWQFPAAEVSETKFMSLDVNWCISDEKTTTWTWRNRTPSKHLFVKKMTFLNAKVFFVKKKKNNKHGNFVERRISFDHGGWRLERDSRYTRTCLGKLVLSLCEAG